MNIIFKDTELEQLVLYGKSRKYVKYTRDAKFIEKLTSAINIMRAVKETSMLANYSFLHYEKLKRVDLSSVRVMNGRIERLIFKEINNGIEIEMLELNNDHYGKK
jgi:plasmid maintenance system killer protein